MTHGTQRFFFNHQETIPVHAPPPRALRAWKGSGELGDLSQAQLEGYGRGMGSPLLPEHHWGAVCPLTPCLHPQSLIHVSPDILSSIHHSVRLSVHPADAKHAPPAPDTEDTEGAVMGRRPSSVGTIVTSAMKAQGGCCGMAQRGGGGSPQNWGRDRLDLLSES